MAVFLAASFAGCSLDTPEPDDPEVEDGLTLVEGHPRWSTNSVAWKDAPQGGTRFAFISVALEVGPYAPSHFLFDGEFSLGCQTAECFPIASQLFVQENFDIYNVDWAPQGGQAVFEGQAEGEAASWIYTWTGQGPRQWLRGHDPSYTPDGGLVFYVEPGRDGIHAFNPSSGGGFLERGGLADAAHPRVSHDGHYVAYSAFSARGTQIYVHNREEPQNLADAVSDPDRLNISTPGRDGIGDDYPDWSPGGNFIVYRGSIREGTAQDGIFLTAWKREPENPVSLIRITPGRQMTYLRWHPSGVYLLAIIDGDVYVFTVPEAYRDLG